MEAIITTLKKMKKDDIINLISKAIGISEINEDIFEILLIENHHEQFNAFSMLIDDLVFFDRFLDISYDSALNAIETYFKISNNHAGKIVLQFKFVNCLIGIASMNGEFIDGTFEIEEVLFDELEDALISAREHNLLTIIDPTVSSFLAFSKVNHFPNWERLLNLYSSYYDHKPEKIDSIIKEMIEEAKKTKIAFENGESFADIFDDLDDDDDLDSIFGEDDDDWDDDDDDVDSDEAPEPIRKANPKEKITKLF